jgi:hypothetical protein
MSKLLYVRQYTYKLGLFGRGIIIFFADSEAVCLLVDEEKSRISLTIICEAGGIIKTSSFC